MASKLKQYKKVAIVHDILYEFGGAEIVLLELLKLFPDAQLYTFFYNNNNEAIKKMFPQQINSSFFSRIPFIFLLGKYISILKLVSWIYFLFLDFKKYDLVISSSHSYNSKIVQTNTTTKHISYIHTPPRYLYFLSNELDFLHYPIVKFLLAPFFYCMRKIDLFAANQPDILIANSKEVQQRIHRIYKRNSFLIYPPVSYPKKVVKKTSKFFIAHSRLVKQKGIELLVRTCTIFNFPLVVIGSGYQENFLRSIAGKTVFFTGFLPKEQVVSLYKHAKALLYAAKEEDFGIIPVEAQALGVPVVAYNSGAIQETVQEAVSGVLYSRYTVWSLRNAMITLKSLKISPNSCRKNAVQFKSDNFRKKFKKIVYETI